MLYHRSLLLIYFHGKTQMNILANPIYKCVYVLVTQSCLTHCDPMEYSLPGSSDHGILQARKLGWAAFPFSRGSSWSRDRTQISRLWADSLSSEPPGKSIIHIKWTPGDAHHPFIYMCVCVCVFFSIVTILVTIDSNLWGLRWKEMVSHYEQS